jgi:hypothetical protein
MLLLDVRAEVAPEKESALNTWYYTHVPRLVSIPGYVSGRRYVALGRGPRYAALYEIDGRSSLPLLLGEDPARRHPLTLSEWDAWERDLVPFMSHCSTNLYEPVLGTSPLLHGDHPIVELRFEVAGGAEVLTELDDVLASALTATRDVVSATRFQAASYPETAWLRTHPDQLVLIETRSERTATQLCERAELVGRIESLVRTAGSSVEIVAYRQVARHWPWFKEEAQP